MESVQAETISWLVRGVMRGWSTSLEMQCLPEAGNGLQMTATKRTGTSVLQHWGTEFCQHPKEQETSPKGG